MLKLIIRFPQMEAAIKAVPYPLNEGTEKEKWYANCRKWRTAEHTAMAQLEETAFALAMERIRRKTGTAGYYSDHAGLCPEYSFDKHGFEIYADSLYPELIAAFEDLQKLGSFEMRFETEDGKVVGNDWWHDDAELMLYDPVACTNYDYDAMLTRATA